jgi:orotidine-5'-phosphate decarboxylase
LDLKLCDIPETVERAVASAAGLGAAILTVHATGGPAMLKRAVQRAEREGTGLCIAAVTVMTSLDGADLEAIGVGPDLPGQVMRLARLAFDQGVRAFICSAADVRPLRQALGSEVTLLTPGVRSEQDVGRDDQKRVATAARAAADGADWLVVGRPIRDAADPLAAARALAHVAQAASSRAGAASPSAAPGR